MSRCDTYIRIGQTEPGTTFWRNENCESTSTKAIVDNGYHMLKGTAVGKDSVSSMIIAPHHTLTMGSHGASNNQPDLRADRVLVVPKGNRRYVRMKNATSPIGNDNADWYKISVRKPWDQWKADACTGKENDITGYFKPRSAACDQVMSQYCAKSSNRSKDECGCFNSKVPNPSCHEVKCAASFNAYKTKAMYDTINSGCPTYMDCSQYINLAAGVKNNVLNNVYLQQTCTVDGAGNTTTTTPNGTVPGPAPVPPPSTTPSWNPPSPYTPPNNTYNPPQQVFKPVPDTSNNMLIIGGAALVFIIFLVIILMIAFSGGDKPKPRLPAYPPQYYPGYRLQ